MFRRTFIALAAALALTAPALALDREMTEEERALIGEINAHNSAIKTMVGRFLQIDTQGQRIEGTFFLERPGKIRFRYNPPSREEIISVGRGFYVIDRQEQTQYAYPQDKVPLRQFLESDIDLFKANITAIEQSADYATITLQDDTPAGIVTVSLVFDKETKDLRQWTLVDPSGSELTFSLYDVEFGVEIPKSFFYIDPTYKAVNPTG
ncbi:MAG TPA: outer membrane lipoprotein carrier protein LolA [Alphaproteobacteria bacterium]|nr:outer membrane lipoprotein carrier protein LolA [Alphaproteobacteria bacterium]